ncbi:hypothetical protein CPB83DRAFT_862227 [Crepidotus variabilis]|uniref:BTB domain-containing protein n=1 Tax=Crepidotus variabilis TaxID=179855 RepID=A0A9P6JKH7_9AGAR|nr:hypothetical protein CPB83DRAFT_862227 [Crepidotus variabilis]
MSQSFNHGAEDEAITLSSHESSVTYKPEAPSRDTSFYFRNVIFKVENKLFCVPRHGFEVPGTVFEAMFALPAPGVTTLETMEGMTDDNPIVLPVEKTSFRGFLRMMYPFSGHPPLEIKDWLGALELANMWSFSKIRCDAIQQLNSYFQQLPAKEAVILAKKFRVENWLREGYRKLVEGEHLTLEELRETPVLEESTLVVLFYTKYRLFQQRAKNGYMICSECNTHTYGPCPKCYVRIIVNEGFKQELEDMKIVALEDPPLPVVEGINEAQVVSNSKKKKKKLSAYN